jgi:hypothetical protein
MFPLLLHYQVGIGDLKYAGTGTDDRKDSSVIQPAVPGDQDRVMTSSSSRRTGYKDSDHCFSVAPPLTDYEYHHRRVMP